MHWLAEDTGKAAIRLETQQGSGGTLSGSGIPCVGKNRRILKNTLNFIQVY